MNESTNYKDLTELHEIKEGETFPIYPGQTVLSTTLENVKISDKYCALLGITLIYNNLQREDLDSLVWVSLFTLLLLS